MAHYPSVESSPDFPALENTILDFWKKQSVFTASIENRPSSTHAKTNEFIFYDGPPFANGLPHYGHLLTGFVKDAVARYQTMQGKRVERRFGWDCHGLPAEMATEKELGVSGRAQITAFGIDKFNDHCRKTVLKYTKEWEAYVTRQARWVDFKNDYKTMDRSYMESVMWAFKQLHEKGLVYESVRVMPYSWACETPLSNFETRLDNAYRERADKAVTVAFTLKQKPDGAPSGYSTYKILAWTTTPWTLPSNLALAVGEEIPYVCVEKEGICYIIARSSLPHYRQEFGEVDAELLPALTGKQLAGLRYQPLFPYFADKEKDGAFTVLIGDFVLEGDGTGTVHLAPGFGEDDFELCKKHSIPLVCPVDNAGKFTAEVPDFQGLQVFDANDEVIKRLKTDGAWIKTEQYLHNYPHCWRTDTPLIYKTVPSWYVEVTKFRDRMVQLNQQINWIPGHVKDGLFGKWLENARDWSISRNRFWGAPIPVWKSDDARYPRIDVYGSIAELERDFGVKVEDLHKPFIDSLTRPNPDDPTGKSRMVRVPDVFDCWFESGSMPYAQVHYPFENKDWFEHHFPADFIVEYTAQTRGWFYTLMVLSTALFDRPPFLNCICHGVILDDKGQKLSKRLNNYADPMELFGKFGADSLRWLMLSSPVMRGQELLIDKDGNMVRDTLRLSVKPMWNAYHFFTLYANVDGIEATYDTSSQHVMDRYILAKAGDAVRKVKTALDTYDTPVACDAITQFFEVLNNWYIRRSRERFWSSEKNADKQQAYNTLYTVLHSMCRVAAPLLPLLTESMFLGLTAKGALDVKHSVHLADYPDASLFPADIALTKAMDRVRDVCNSALSIRNTENLRVRLPLASLTVVGKESNSLEPFAAIIQEEVNVKVIQFSEDINAFATFKPQLNFPVLGKRLPAKMKDIIAASKKGEWSTNAEGRIVVCGETLEPAEGNLLLEAKTKKGTQALSTNDALVVLDTEITPLLKAEGTARDVVRAIQQARKDAQLHVADRIDVTIEGPDEIAEAVTPFKDYVASQTLAVSITFGPVANAPYKSDAELEEGAIRIGFRKH